VRVPNGFRGVPAVAFNTILRVKLFGREHGFSTPRGGIRSGGTKLYKSQ
jgi:hypothetical protein